MKKQLNAESMVNELRGGSSFFRPREEVHLPRAVPQPESPKLTQSIKPARTDGRTVPYDIDLSQAQRVGFSPPPNKLARPIGRHSFDIYTDQLEALRRLKAQKMLMGEQVSLAQMVRDALDTYLETMSDEK